LPSWVGGVADAAFIAVHATRCVRPPSGLCQALVFEWIPPLYGKIKMQYDPTITAPWTFERERTGWLMRMAPLPEPMDKEYILAFVFFKTPSHWDDDPTTGWPIYDNRPVGIILQNDRNWSINLVRYTHGGGEGGGHSRKLHRRPVGLRYTPNKLPSDTTPPIHGARRPKPLRQ